MATLIPQKVDDTAFVPATDLVVPVGAMYDDIAVDLVNEGDVGIPRMSEKRVPYAQLRDAAGNERGMNIDSAGRPTVTSLSRDDQAFVNDTDRPFPMGAIVDDTGGTTLAEDRIGIPRMSAGRELIIRLQGGPLGSSAQLAIDALGKANVITEMTPVLITTGNLGALNDVVTASSTTGYAWHAFEIAAGTLVGTVICEATYDTVNWFTIYSVRSTDGAEIQAMTAFPTRGEFQLGNARNIRLRVAVYSAGSCIARILSCASASRTVRIGGVYPGNTQQSLGKMEDAAHGNSDVGVAVWAVRNNEASPTTFAGANGDYSPFAVEGDGTLWTGGNRAHDTADAGNPLKIGGKASTSRPTAVADADRVNAWLDSVGRQLIRHDDFNRSDTYTATANGTTVDATANPVKYFSIQVKGTGAAPTTWDIRLEVSLDGTNFTTIITHATADGDGIVKALASPFPARYFRSRCAGIALGGATNAIATIIGMN